MKPFKISLIVILILVLSITVPAMAGNGPPHEGIWADGVSRNAD